MRELGVGLVYWPELAAVFEDTASVGALEVEPQAYWEKVRGSEGDHYRPNDALLQQIAQYPQAKLLHGVGQPIGGTVDDPVEYLAPLKSAIDLLDPVWISEHLSFNRTVCDGTCQEAGFLLPPRQSPAGVHQAVLNIEKYAQATKRPFAFETGVNYLQRRDDEIDDGAYFGAVAAQAECGIVLDLHNLWCNEKNGRGRVLDVIAKLPLDRVWELHLAGGMAFQGYWLDAHSDVVPAGVYELAAQIIPRLPNLGAIVFEILPQHLPNIGIDGVRRQLAALDELWLLRPARTVVANDAVTTRLTACADRDHAADHEEVAAWEASLAAAIRGDKECAPRFTELSHDPGIRVFRELINDARRSNLSRSLRYTTTLLLVAMGMRETLALLDAYFAQQTPETYAAIEADHFASFLLDHPDVLSRIPYLSEVVAFEHALVRATIRPTSTDLVWSTDPTAILSALDEGRAPAELPSVRSTMRVSSA
ncbi:hypothetical protein B0E48_08520 [Rhodanobacter sp. C03]|nr:hypothetical protein B0E48_08520 [Rhodanobacter sp. C03]